jgi:Uma2 family endonuclease
LPKDRGVKASLYAESGVPEYWVVNVAESAIEVHTVPADGTYASMIVYRRGARIRLQQFQDVEIRVDDILLR